MCDGVGVVIIVSEDVVKKYYFTSLVRIVGYFVFGCDFFFMGIGKFVVKYVGFVIVLEISFFWYLDFWNSS